ncbi:unnamed protein product [Boreogadus saida]
MKQDTMHVHLPHISRAPCSNHQTHLRNRAALSEWSDNFLSGLRSSSMVDMEDLEAAVDNCRRPPRGGVLPAALPPRRRGSSSRAGGRSACSLWRGSDCCVCGGLPGRAGPFLRRHAEPGERCSTSASLEGRRSCAPPLHARMLHAACAASGPGAREARPWGLTAAEQVGGQKRGGASLVRALERLRERREVMAGLAAMLEECGQEEDARESSCKASEQHIPDCLRAEGSQLAQQGQRVWLVDALGRCCGGVTQRHALISHGSLTVPEPISCDSTFSVSEPSQLGVALENAQAVTHSLPATTTAARARGGSGELRDRQESMTSSSAPRRTSEGDGDDPGPTRTPSDRHGDTEGQWLEVGGDWRY